LEFYTFDGEVGGAVIPAQNTRPRGPINVNDLSGVFLDDCEDCGQGDFGVVRTEGGECFVDVIFGGLGGGHF
jgi:hypothetical protein